ncbi:RNA polymerase sigma factor [Pelomonas sp. KK5]|uniref:RNA polymerase sigma factor n=1 Tax=Pelomonas sp. KK5 TaxID=1855730 RepID=UPI00097C295C|nr:RNA polymerase sigma factor [Pelomonas sp. KK5]
MPDPQALDDWFIAEVLPQEPALMRLLGRHWRHSDELTDLRQDVYVRVYEAARASGLPENPRSFLFAVARNLIIDRVRRLQVVDIELVAEPDALGALSDDIGPDRVADSRRELRRLQQALEALPPRCREVVTLRKIEGLSQKEIAEKLGIALGTVEKQVTLGIRALAQSLGGPAKELAQAWTQKRRRRETER